MYELFSECRAIESLPNDGVLNPSRWDKVPLLYCEVPAYKTYFFAKPIPLRLAFSETINSQNMGICIVPDEQISSQAQLIEIIVPGNVQKSMMHFRLNSTAENNRMPLLGRTIVHEEGVQLLKDFINSISTCD